MHINVVTLDSGWILPKIAQRTIDNYPNSDIKFTLELKPITGPFRPSPADVNYYVDLQNCYDGYNTGCDIGYFTHVHQNDMGWLSALWRQQKIYQLKGIINMNYRYTPPLIAMGFPADKIITLVPGETKGMFPLRKIVIGIVSRGGQLDYGTDFMVNLLSSYNCANFKFRFLGDGWERLYPIVESRKIEAEFLSDADYSIYPAFYQSIDYLLIQGVATAGPMAMQEALSTGIPIIGANVGFVNHEFKADYVYEPGNVAQLAAILDTIQRPALARRAQVEDMSWQKYATDVVNFIRKIKGEV